MSAAASDTDFWGTTASQIQSGITVTGNKITGTLLYRDSGQIVTDWGAGYFIGLTMSDVASDATSVKAGMYPSQGSGYVTLDEDLTILCKVTDKDTQFFDVIQTDGTRSHIQRFDLSGLTLQPAGGEG